MTVLLGHMWFVATRSIKNFFELNTSEPLWILGPAQKKSIITSSNFVEDGSVRLRQTKLHFPNAIKCLLYAGTFMNKINAASRHHFFHSVQSSNPNKHISLKDTPRLFCHPCIFLLIASCQIGRRSTIEDLPGKVQQD